MSLPATTYASIQLGLQRISGVLCKLGNPQNKVPIIHVAGTNGKGSVCAFLSSVLQQSGLKTGKYTSPHLLDWRETITIQNEMISTEKWDSTIARIKDTMESNDPLTPFEIATAASFLHFAEENADVAVIEVGLGGRLDATNVIEKPIASVITSIGYDHMEFLGPTLTHIATEKAGIIKAGAPVFYSSRLPTDAIQVMKGISSQMGVSATAITPAIEAQRDIDNTHEMKSWFEYVQKPRSMSLDGFHFDIHLAGEHQNSNAALAVSVAQYMQKSGWKISDANIRDGMKSTQWPMRLQPFKTSSGLSLIVDGAHNQEAAVELGRYVDDLRRRFNKPICWIFGCLKSKSPKTLLTPLLKKGDHLVCVPVRRRAADAADLDETGMAARKVCKGLGSFSQFGSLEDALEFVDSVEFARSSIPVLCGSLYLVAELLDQKK